MLSGGGDDGNRPVRLVLIGPAGQQGGDRPAEPEGLERFHDPALRPRAPGEEHVGSAVEEHEHGHVREPPGAPDGYDPRGGSTQEGALCSKSSWKRVTVSPSAAPSGSSTRTPSGSSERRWASSLRGPSS